MESLHWIEVLSAIIEYVAVAIITISVFAGLIIYLFHFFKNQWTLGETLHRYKQILGRALLLSLEILVAADVIRTVVLGPNLTNVTVLGLLVVIRTFLSWSISVEMEGHWPWEEKNPK